MKEAPTVIPLQGEKIYKFKDIEGKIIDVKIYNQERNIFFKTEIMENKLNKRNFTAKYSVDEIKENNKYFFLCQTIEDVIKQIDLLAKDNQSLFVLDGNKIILTIPTNMNLAPEIKIELKEESKSIESKVNDINDYIVKSEKQNENNMALLIKENKEIKDLMNIIIKENQEIKEVLKSMKNSYDILVNENKEIKQSLFEFSSWQGYYKLDEKYFDRIKDWIGGDKNKIKFELIFNINEGNLTNKRDAYHSKCNIKAPAIFIFITSKMSIFGAYCPNYHTSDGKWVADSNAFLFSLNLNKKYPALKSGNNYHTGTCGFHFNDIEFCSINDRKGTFGKTGVYMNNYELEGNENSFTVEQFLVYRVIK